VISISLTNEQRNLEPIGSAFCEHYQTEAKFYIERSISLRPGSGTGARHLIVQYGQSYTGRDDLPVTATGQREFAIIIPDDSPQVSTGSDQEFECALSDVGGASAPARKASAV
jgi:hypothetical protein